MFVAVQQRLMVLGVINLVRRITVDFEMGAYDAFKNVFGHSIDCIQKDYAFAKRDVMASQGGQPIDNDRDARQQDTILILLIFVFNTETMCGPIIFLNILGG